MQNLVTVFGGSGFIGAQTVRQLAKAGWRIRVAIRNPNLGYAMRLHGDVGQIDVVQANVRNEASVRRALEGATAAVNLVGVLYEAGRQGFQAVHVMGAKTVAEAVRAEGIPRLVQMSALGADPAAASKYARTKAEGELAARDAVPGAVVVRPSIVFGSEDHFFNRFAALAAVSPALPLIGGGKTRFQPVFVGDVGKAIARLASDPAAAGQTYELGGPATFTFRELMEMMLRETGRRRLLAPVPFPVARLLGAVGDLAAGVVAPPITADQVELLKTDNVVSGAYPGLPDLGITPTTVESVLPTYLYRYRRGGQYADQEDREMAAERA
ncbi:complex I NDUFA9 subunit family protein [Phenylobacterium hankyongense]|uniref:Complex I NDUFA9 subunit family protein n=1 Tax=Phenylobacterium hankyongense TaxID=1813876 RepID=A0A328AXF9_9CAUL|nr:complex I NDUFA9 subunit family protein [Phenylobacterium hankyongense]RAK59653.1 complex I NDUFA9 subunit family protein [Phenylobacterium hankyongense]